MIKPISKLSTASYKHIAKPILFKFSPENVHDATIKSAKLSGKIVPLKGLIKASWAYQNPILEQTIDGIFYKNPIGLAAGWDKDALAAPLMESIGFGFTEVGSITQHSYKGNPGTRLWRLPKSKSIMVYYGLKNDGVDVIADRLKKMSLNIPMGTNIAYTNSPTCNDDKSAIADYAYSFKKLANIGDYFTINISCPNTYGGQPFNDKERLHKLLTVLDDIETNKPVYIKLSPDISQKERRDIADLAFEHRVHGFVCGNLTKNRQLAQIKDINVPEQGGMSGKIVQDLSDELIADMYKYSGGKKTIIGLGGVFNTQDAYKKLQAGANLVQLITGLIYQGPQIVGQINKDLAEILHKQKNKNIKSILKNY